MSVLYHPDKANVVVDALSYFFMGILSHVEEAKKNLVRDVHRLSHLGVRIEDYPNRGVVVHHNSKQHLDPLLMDLKELVLV